MKGREGRGIQTAGHFRTTLRAKKEAGKVSGVKRGSERTIKSKGEAYFTGSDTKPGQGTTAELARENARKRHSDRYQVRSSISSLVSFDTLPYLLSFPH